MASPLDQLPHTEHSYHGNLPSPKRSFFRALGIGFVIGGTALGIVATAGLLSIPLSAVGAGIGAVVAGSHGGALLAGALVVRAFVRRRHVHSKQITPGSAPALHPASKDIGTPDAGIE